MKSNIIFNIINMPGYGDYVAKGYMTTYIQNSKICNKKQKTNISLFSKFFLFALLIMVLEGFSSYTYKFENSKEILGGIVDLINKRNLSESSNEGITDQLKLNLLRIGDDVNREGNNPEQEPSLNESDSETDEGNDESLESLKKNEGNESNKISSGLKGKSNNMLQRSLMAAPFLFTMAMLTLNNSRTPHIPVKALAIYLGYVGALSFIDPFNTSDDDKKKS
ncbi:Plasmodium exported protein, unknown function [Plasmodium gallinaceum]|uniref:Uncharacterized protein n=1 Tax=Plasmodium gallinaceum TaxID=5849 RepID=A0A1J1GYI7_PLAGA|nr:Plasmodium exported protein, unknown function [Plasmodium gallinaceum]CRG96083.1 Plasmodium exported protein, unknown function [Plasmodium gallinaceum]